MICYDIITLSHQWIQNKHCLVKPNPSSMKWMPSSGSLLRVKLWGEGDYCQKFLFHPNLKNMQAILNKPATWDLNYFRKNFTAWDLDCFFKNRFWGLGSNENRMILNLSNFPFCNIWSKSVQIFVYWARMSMVRVICYYNNCENFFS